MKARRAHGICLLLSVLLSLSLPASSLAALDEMVIARAEQRDDSLHLIVDATDPFGSPVPIPSPDTLLVGIDRETAAITSLSSLADAPQPTLYVFLIDTGVPLPEDAAAQARESLTRWLEDMNADDQAALVAFGGALMVVGPLSAGTERDAMLEAVGLIGFADAPSPVYDALEAARGLTLAGGDSLPARRVFVLLSDLAEEGSSDGARGAAAGGLADGGASLYIVAYENSAGESEALEALAQGSGGAVIPAVSGGKVGMNVRAAFDLLRARVRGAWSITADLSGMPITGGPQTLAVTATVGDAQVSASRAMTLSPTNAAPAVPEATAAVAANVTVAPTEPPARDFLSAAREFVYSARRAVLLLDTAQLVVYAGGGVLALVFVILLIRLLAKRAKRRKLRRRFDAIPPVQTEAPVPAMREPLPDEERTLAPPEDATQPMPEMYTPAPETEATVYLQHRLVCYAEFTVRIPGAQPYVTKLDIGDNFIIGRVEDCSLVLADRSISRHHARLAFDGVVLTIEDLGSVNGLFLEGGGRVEGRAIVKPGDAYRLGAVQLAIQAGVREE